MLLGTAATLVEPVSVVLLPPVSLMTTVMAYVPATAYW